MVRDKYGKTHDLRPDGLAAAERELCGHREPCARVDSAITCFQLQGIERVYVVPVLRRETEARDVSGPKGILGCWRAHGREIYFAQGSSVMAYDFVHHTSP